MSDLNRSVIPSGLVVYALLTCFNKCLVSFHNRGNGIGYCNIEVALDLVEIDFRHRFTKLSNAIGVHVDYKVRDVGRLLK